MNQFYDFNIDFLAFAIAFINYETKISEILKMQQKIFESATMKARNYKIQRKLTKLSFNVIYY
jgi:hypothetical protein